MTQAVEFVAVRSNSRATSRLLFWDCGGCEAGQMNEQKWSEIAFAPLTHFFMRLELAFVKRRFGKGRYLTSPDANRQARQIVRNNGFEE